MFSVILCYAQIAPCSLVGQWETECDERSEGRLKWKRYYGQNRSRRVKDYVEKDIVLTTYGIMAKEKGEGAHSLTLSLMIDQMDTVHC